MDLHRYKHFVNTLLSSESKFQGDMIARLEQLDMEYSHINWPALLTAADGMSAEAGEFMEVVKKIQWQGKEPTPEIEFHLKRELGDILFYATTACVALGIELDEVIEENVRKLEKRYPGGHFNVHHSENRAEDDL